MTRKSQSSKTAGSLYTTAMDAAAKLAGELGDDWRPETWENSGWHYQAVRGTMRVYCQTYSGSGKTVYYCDTGTVPQHFGEGPTPGAAVAAALHEAEQYLRLQIEQLRGLGVTNLPDSKLINPKRRRKK